MTELQEAVMHAVHASVAKIRPHLAGLKTEIQGCILAELLAIWASGHVVEGDQAETAALREEILMAHIDCVRLLVPVMSEALAYARKQKGEAGEIAG
jgi:hypothetical protein